MHTREHFTWDTPVDRMSHHANLFDAEFTINKYDFEGVVDRRFKTGYRVIPSHGVNIMVNLTVLKDDRYQVRQLWQVGKPKTHNDLGIYMVTSVSPDTAELIPVSISQNNDKKSINVGGKLEFIYYGHTIGEGSS